MVALPAPALRQAGGALRQRARASARGGDGCGRPEQAAAAVAPGTDARGHLLGVPGAVPDDRDRDDRRRRCAFDLTLARRAGLVRAFGRRLRGACADRRDRRLPHPQGPETCSLQRQSPGRGGPDPRVDRGHRHHAAHLARVADRAAPERLPGAVGADIQRTFECHLPCRAGARARGGMGSRAHHPFLSRLSALLEAPAHPGRGLQRLFRKNTLARPHRAHRFREARDRGSVRVGARRRHDVEADARRDVLHGVRTLSGRLPRLQHRQTALAEAADHELARPPFEPVGGADRAQRRDRRRRVGLRDVRRVRARVPGGHRAHRPRDRPASQPGDGRIAVPRRGRDDASRRRPHLQSLGQAAGRSHAVGGGTRCSSPAARRAAARGPLLGRLRARLRRARAQGRRLDREVDADGRCRLRGPGTPRGVHRRPRPTNGRRVHVSEAGRGKRRDIEPIGRAEDRHDVPALLQHDRQRIRGLRWHVRGRPSHTVPGRPGQRRQARAHAERTNDHLPRLVLPGAAQRRPRGAT